MKDKKIDFHADMEKEERDFFDKLKTDRDFVSNRELMKFVRLSLEGKTDFKKPIIACGHLSSDGSLCGQNFKKTNSVKCELCLREEALKEEREKQIRARDLEAFTGFLDHDPINVILGLKRVLKLRDDQNEELKKPMLDFINERDTLNSRCAELKNALIARLEEISSLEIDNTQLRQQVEEMSHDPLVEKNFILTVKLGKAEKIIEDLKLEISKLETLHEQEVKFRAYTP